MPVGTLDQHQDSEGASFGFGEFAVVRYRGQNFTPAVPGFLSSIGFSRDLGLTDIKVYVDITDGSHLPVHAVGSELYSFIIPNASLVNGYGTYDLPVPLPLAVGTEYCFYLAPFVSGVYSDDYRDCHGITSRPAGSEITNTAGSWATENLTFHFATYMLSASALSAFSVPNPSISRLRTVTPY